MRAVGKAVPGHHLHHPVAPGDELLQGAEQIALFLFGNKRYRRKVYHLVEKGKLPVIRLGGITARKSTLMDYLGDQEQQSLAGSTH